ncbi:hypothetical protein GCM10027290_47200 [Micromonospora sonneratiae]|uniref:Peptidase inhibitor family I36 n=1 Tax=Micromonospora sonneratiae TaxID=1184706 RepID=A0ABW3YAP4_9ACTN
MKIRRYLMALATGFAVLVGGVVVAPAPAQAAVDWDLTYSSWDAVGSWGYGSWWSCGDRVCLEVNVKDTAADGKGAGVCLRAKYNDGGRRDEQVHNSGGNGSTKTVTYSFAGNVFEIDGGEYVGSAATSCFAGSLIY